MQRLIECQSQRCKRERSDVYVNFVLKKKKHILGRIGLNFLGDLGSSRINFGDLGSISKILLGS